MNFGSFHLFSCPPWNSPEQAIEFEYEQMVHADKIGLHEVWLGEHNARTYGIAGNSVLTASTVAAMTENVRIGTAVVRLPLHHPLHLAEDLAHADIVSKGRLDFGIGKGYDALEFSTYGVPFEEREERWQETYDAVLQYWNSGRTAFKGAFSAGEDAQFFPGSVQKPHMPIYVIISRSDASVMWAAERLYPFVISSACDRQDTKAKLELFQRTALKAGHSEADVQDAVSKCWQMKTVHVASSHEAAYEEFKDSMDWYFEQKNNRLMFGFGSEPLPASYFLNNGAVAMGTPEHVAQEMVEHKEETGIQNILCWFNVGGQPQGQTLESMSRFAEEVMPQV